MVFQEFSTKWAFCGWKYVCAHKCVCKRERMKASVRELANIWLSWSVKKAEMLGTWVKGKNDFVTWAPNSNSKAGCCCKVKIKFLFVQWPLLLEPSSCVSSPREIMHKKERERENERERERENKWESERQREEWELEGTILSEGKWERESWRGQF